MQDFKKDSHVTFVEIFLGEMYSPFLETYPSTELPFVLVVGQEVRLNARRVNGSKYDFQVKFLFCKVFKPVFTIL